MAERDYSDPYGRPTTGYGFGRGNPVVAGTEYYSDLENALKLLASADAQRSTTNSTAGEAMRFYNMFRDARLRDRPTAVDTQALIAALNSNVGEDYLGGISDAFYPVYEPNRNVSADRLKPVRTNFIIGQQSDIDTSGGLEPEPGDVYPDFWAARIQDKGYSSSFETTPEQFERMLLSSRANLPLDAEMQLLASRYLAENFRIPNTIDSVLNTIPEHLTQYLRSVNFQSPSNYIFDDLGALAYAKGGGARFDSWYEEPEVHGGSIDFPMNQSISGNPDSWWRKLIGLESPGFKNVLRHELAHIVDSAGSGVVGERYQPKEKDREWEWATRPAPVGRGVYGGHDYSENPAYLAAILSDATNFPEGLNLEFNTLGTLSGEKYLPFATDYGRDFAQERSDFNLRPHGGMYGRVEDFADRMMMYLMDKEQGWIAESRPMNPFGSRTRYRFAELYPESAKYFDTIFDPETAFDAYSGFSPEWNSASRRHANKPGPDR